MKKYLFLLFSLTLLSCNDETENLKQEIGILKAKNDSLNIVLDTLKTKFIFDKASIINIVNDNERMIVGKKYEGKFYFVAYNYNDRLLFKQSADSKSDTLLQIRGGGYTYEFIAKKGENHFFFNPLILDETAREFSNSYLDGTTIFDKRIVD